MLARGCLMKSRPGSGKIFGLPGLCVLESKQWHKEKVTLTCLVATNQPKNSTALFLMRGKKYMKSHLNLNIIRKIFILLLFLVGFVSFVFSNIRENKSHVI